MWGSRGGSPRGAARRGGVGTGLGAVGAAAEPALPPPGPLLLRRRQDPFRKFKGPEGYKALDFVPTNVQARLLVLRMICTEQRRGMGNDGGGGLCLLQQRLLSRVQLLVGTELLPADTPAGAPSRRTQGAAVSIEGMRMLDNSSAEIRWRLTGKLGVLPVDVAGAPGPQRRARGAWL